MSHSTEEEVARDFICFEEPDAVIVVCDATCMERNQYPSYIEDIIGRYSPRVQRITGISNNRWLTTRLLDADDSLLQSIMKSQQGYGTSPMNYGAPAPQ